ncbi:MAG: flagellar biosynthesis protein FlhA [Limisphaerales bacterium]|nr:MAG: flagellar biosynthesis protein FlhA [Limisphaerales bacterium]KAG0507104.1 MAG: flagellar biosynthesis protein FlhA [Limisphaerales bacterium]TXT49308.1 MAG: flagellar biosynthesis protein FlhA [Limisphaerales bacterium]
MANLTSSISRLLKQGDLWLTGSFLGIILLLILPVSPFLLDLLLALSIALALLIALVILYVKEPAEFTGFPTLLLIVTLFRLALNVASTRLILLDGYAGHIIEAFGSFVVRGNYVVGLVVFAILVLINFIVITKGAGRIAEVAARFTLDAMPGKQMAIDAELNAGVINEEQARARRRKVEQEADFYGAMDGASKFVRGDAIAAVLITVINVVGGFAIGIMQKGMTIGESLERFTLLSIGDGLVSQIPALITSVAAGILVTRAASKDELSKELGKQLFYSPRVLMLLAGMLLLMAVVPGLPTIPFLGLAVAVWLLAETMKRHNLFPETAEAGAGAALKTASGAAAKPGAPATSGAAPSDKMESLLTLDTLQIELGYGLVSLADARKGGDLLDRVTGVRRNFASDMGLLIPPIRLRDNLQLGANEYRFLLKGSPMAKGELMPGYWLAMNATNSKAQLKGVPTVEPVFQLPATWITDVERKHAEVSGHTVVDAASVLVTHLSETVRRHCHEILTRQDVQVLLDNLKQTHPTVVNELIPAQLTVGQVQRILQNLLAEGISIRNLAGILEKIGDYAHLTKNPDELSEHARRALGPQLAKPFQQENGSLRAITLDPRLEQQIAQGLRQSPSEISLTMEPRLARHVVDSLSKFVSQMVATGHAPVVLCAPQIRLAFRRFFETTFADLAVLAYNEVPARAEVQTTAVVPCPE